MRMILLAAAAAAALAGPAHAQPELERGFAAALRGCEQWILNPATWADGVARFPSAAGLGGVMAQVGRVEDVSLPPPALRVANHYWRINSTPGAGFILVVSDQLPMCHITGGGNVDLQPGVESVLATPEFSQRWERMKVDSRGELNSTLYRNREEPEFSILISRAKAPGGRLDRVQLVATAVFRTDK